MMVSFFFFTVSNTLIALYMKENINLKYVKIWKKKTNFGAL